MTHGDEATNICIIMSWLSTEDSIDMMHVNQQLIGMIRTHRYHMLAVRQKDHTSYYFTMSHSSCDQLSTDCIIHAQRLVRVGACQITAAWVH
jgi:hypothetical protein